MAGILIYSDRIKSALEILAAARQMGKELGLPVKAVSINDDGQADALCQNGAEVQRVNNPSINPADAASVATALKQAADILSASIVLLASNRRSKEVAGRLAQMLNAGCLTDVNDFQVKNGRIECARNALGGATVSIQVIESENQVISLIPKAVPIEGEATGTVNDLQVEIPPSRIKLVSTKSKSGDAVNIESAEVLIAVGQGLERQEDLRLAEVVARSMGGELACSKPVATDRKWLPEERVIGLSGKKCQPRLAILLGISGQVQFVVGIREAKTIVAVNTDENAYINKMADYVLIADLKDVLPELAQAVGGK